TNVDMPGPSSAGPSMASPGSVVHDQNVPHLTLQHVADGGEGAEPDCARPVVLEDREVDHGDADAVRQLSQRHGSLLEQLIQPAVDAVPVLELGWAHTSPASSRSLTAPLRQMLPRTTSASPAATALQGRAASPKAGTLARSANWEVSRIQRLSSHAPRATMGAPNAMTTPAAASRRALLRVNTSSWRLWATAPASHHHRMAMASSGTTCRPTCAIPCTPEGKNCTDHPMLRSPWFWYPRLLAWSADSIMSAGRAASILSRVPSVKYAPKLVPVKSPSVGPKCHIRKPRTGSGIHVVQLSGSSHRQALRTSAPDQTLSSHSRTARMTTPF